MEVVHLGLQANANTVYDWWNHGEAANCVENVPAWMQYIVWACDDAIAAVAEAGSVLYGTR